MKEESVPKKKYKAKDYRYYRFEGMFELPRWLDMLEFMWMLVKLVEKVGGYVGGGFIEVNKNGKEIKHGKEK